MNMFTIARYLLLLLAYADSTYSQYYITPSLNDVCPQHSGPNCLTLSQFAANPSNDNNISLIFLHGNHTLDRALSLANGNSFMIAKDAQINENVYVECVQRVGRFNIRNTLFASIKDLQFIGCGGNTITQVGHLLVENSAFQSIEDSGSALVLNHITAARIIKSSFHLNVLQIGSAYRDIPNVIDRLFSFGGYGFVQWVYFGRRPSRSTSSGGALYSAFSNVSIVNSQFSHNQAEQGGILAAHDSTVNILSSYFGHNHASFGGAINATRSQINIYNSTFTENSALLSGGFMMVHKSSCMIKGSNIINNTAFIGGAVITIASMFDIADSTFTDNEALTPYGEAYKGVAAVMLIMNGNLSIHNATLDGTSGTHSFIITHNESSVDISNSVFFGHHGYEGGVMRIYSDASVNISHSTFTDNYGFIGGGVMYLYNRTSVTINNSIFTSNGAFRSGGVVTIQNGSSLDVCRSTFSDNSVTFGYGGVIETSSLTPTNITHSVFTNNSAEEAGGAIRCFGGSINIDNSTFNLNTARRYGGVMILTECPAIISNSKFDHNIRSLYAFNSKVSFSGNTDFENCVSTEIDSGARLSIGESIEVDTRQLKEGGAITSFQSTLIFTGVTNFFNNRAAFDGGSILATESTIVMGGITTMTNNTAAIGNGGGISLHRTILEISNYSYSNISQNFATRGGGIHTFGSTIIVHQPGSLHVLNNSAVYGSGIYLQTNSKLYVLKALRGAGNYLNFIGNHAKYGGAVYVDDDSNPGACSPDNECFFQTLALHQSSYHLLPTTNILFSDNIATVHGSDIFGGLLDRCVPSTFAEVHLKQMTNYSGASYLGNVSNIVMQPYISTVSSKPVRICFCYLNESQPDCSYQPPSKAVKKGETFAVSLAAVDQVNKTVSANIISFLSSFEGGLGEGQQTQDIENGCTDVIYNVFSPYESETLNLYADGPCGSATLSTSNIRIQFIECTCPVGFEPVSNSPNATRCECDCDSKLRPHITECNATTSSITRMNTNSWITYINDTDPPGYVIHPTCPSDYCLPLTESITINFNHPNAADRQCAYSRIGVLCGACQHNLSLSLGSSRCIPCHSHWPAVFVVILVAAIIAGALLVIAILALNITVTVGLIDGFIFYANIVAAGSAVFFPSSEQSFPTIFIAWLNLDIGIDVCFISSLDAYTKTWLQLAFPVYIILLVIIVIVGSDCSSKFAALIGKKDPVATLATLILLSYAKLVSVTITALSFTTLQYPDGSLDYVWLADGNVKYFKGKHIPLALAALLIVVISLPYTILLLFWQWIVRLPRWKILKWTRDSKLNMFMDTHHTPYSRKCRYWTGLLLLVRVVLYIIASVTVSSSPQTLPLVTGILIGAIILIKGVLGLRVYKMTVVDIVDTVQYFNLLAFSLLSQYNFKTDIVKQTVVAYISTIVTFFLLVGAIVFHVYLLLKKEKSAEDISIDEYPAGPIKDNITHTVIELPMIDQSSQSDADDEQEVPPEVTVIKDCGIDAPPSQ